MNDAVDIFADNSSTPSSKTDGFSNNINVSLYVIMLLG